MSSDTAGGADPAKGSHAAGQSAALWLIPALRA